MTFQKRRARRGAKAVSKKRRGRVYAGRGKRRGDGALRGVKVWTARLFLVWAARRFGGALAPLGSPPERLALLNYSGAGFLPRLFFSNSRPQIGARRGGFCCRARARPAGAVFAAPLVGKTPALRRKKTRRKFLPRRLWEKRRAKEAERPVF